LPEFSKEEKDQIVISAIQHAGSILGTAFEVAELEYYIESLIVNEENGESFMLMFFPVRNKEKLTLAKLKNDLKQAKQSLKKVKLERDHFRSKLIKED